MRESKFKNRIRLICSLLGVMACVLSGCHREWEEQGTVIISETEVKLRYAPIPVATLPSVMEADNPAGALQEGLGNAMVRIRAGELAGSGVICEADADWLWIATAAHVLERADGEIKVTFADGYETSTSRVIKAERQDLALLKLERSALVEGSVTGEYMTDHGEEYCRVALEREAFDGARAGDPVIAMGSKSGVGEDAYLGRILQDYVFLEDFDAYMTLADVNVKPGMSGGGVFDAEGRLLGIICGVAEGGEVAVSPVISLMTMDR